MQLLRYVCATCAVAMVSSEEYTTVVTIIGAGASGVSAAKVLYDAGIDFIMVEAKDTVGGRFQDTQFAGYTIEEGASWIHGPLHSDENEANNPLWDYKLKYGIEGNYTTYNNWKISDANGKDVPQAMAEKWWKRIITGMEHCTVKGDELWEQAEEEDLDIFESIDISLDQCLRAYGYWNGTINNETGTNSTLEESVAKLMEWTKVDFEFAELPSEVSTMWGLPLNGEFENRDYLVFDQRGYGIWMDEIITEFPERIKLSETVTSIDASQGDKVTIQSKSGMTIVSDYALCTLPLGVLQRGDVQFSPAFSKKRNRGINGMVMANYAKLHLQFKERFWGDEETILTAGVALVPNEFPWAINYDLPKYLPGSRILSFHVVDTQARKIESQHIDITVAAALEVLRKEYGSDIVSEVTAAHVTNWTNDPLFFGSYSDWPLGYTEEEHMSMIEPLNRLHFGGEHTAAESFGYGHGAIESGLENAELIIELIKNPNLTSSPAPTITSPPTSTLTSRPNSKKSKKSEKNSKTFKSQKGIKLLKRKKHGKHDISKIVKKNKKKFA
eukprot:CAMPEP_0194346556 /NCGR_PEP_ID=MMETSP0171-20130528/105495_1 /TAXON_ID=218684 /ORGANISM="Corethron pennatum, Strain L29A3" /LENGTH=555 /DNA_ID=CAMNT_0039113699 /DNA_START=175 /DNA_END=1842 /DNA_ORIENTATION=-